MKPAFSKSVHTRLLSAAPLSIAVGLELLPELKPYNGRENITIVVHYGVMKLHGSENESGGFLEFDFGVVGEGGGKLETRRQKLESRRQKFENGKSKLENGGMRAEKRGGRRPGADSC